MAILEDVGLEASVVVDGTPLREYEDEDDPTDDGFNDGIPKCRRYVQVDGDAEFGVQVCARSNNKHLDDDRSEKVIGCTVDLDGHNDLVARVIRTKNCPRLLQGVDQYNGRRLVSVRKFRFTTLSTVDDDDVGRLEMDKETAESLGLIRVRVWRAKVCDEATPDQRHSTRLDATDDELAEKALKGKSLSHRATLSAATPTKAMRVNRIESVDPEETPMAIFYFKYRSKAVLQERLLIPKSREPSPQEHDLDRLTIGEVRRLARESVDNLPLHELHRLAQARLSSTKEERITSSERAAKREPGDDHVNPRPRKIVRMSNGREAVDLTEDD